MIGRSKIEPGRAIDEIAETVENRHAFVNFHSAYPVRSMADDQPGARVHGIMRELAQEFRRFVALVRGLVAVDRQDHELGLPAASRITSSTFSSSPGRSVKSTRVASPRVILRPNIVNSRSPGGGPACSD